MKKVEILTANTIPIQYETATLLNRGLALLIDFVVKFAYIFLIIILLGLFFNDLSLFDNETASIIGLYVFIWVPITFYSLILEYFLKGQTIGKLALGIRVVSLNGQNAKFNDYVMRWIFRIVDFWFSAGGIGSILISTSENAQRIGDVLAQTIVVKTKADQSYTIKDILSIKTKKDHTPTYLGVTQFTDDDMIIVKNTISRYKKHPNSAHKEAVVELAENLSSLLKLSEIPKKKISFLRDILQDYVVLTR
ncbi:MAG: RDD family protein [Crocinitomicaceae bacterium]